jgi:hypothetical protein
MHAGGCELVWMSHVGFPLAGTGRRCACPACCYQPYEPPAKGTRGSRRSVLSGVSLANRGREVSDRLEGKSVPD